MTTEVSSPCVSNCCLDDKDICMGCFRSLDEILVWAASTDDQRHGIIGQTATRRLEHQQRYQNSND